jgi:hypothetical protein
LPAQKTFGEAFGEAFGAATGVSDPRLQKIRIRNNGAGGKAATVAGYAGPGFHTWPQGHIPQDTAPNPLLRIRPHAKKTFGETFGAATGVSDPRLQKIRIRNRCASHIPESTTTYPAVLALALETLAKEHTAPDKQTHFHVLKPWLTGDANQADAEARDELRYLIEVVTSTHGT